MTCGIYCITNNINGKQYIGQSIHIEQRFKEHIRYGNSKCYIDRAIKKHGHDAFNFSILLECDESQLSDEEHKFIKLFGTYKNGYNLTWGGEFAISKSPEIAKKIGQKRKGIKHSEETKQKLKKYWEKHKRCGEKHPMYGKHHSEETKEKIRQSLLGTKHSEETKQKMSDSHKGKKMSGECYKKTIKRLKENHPALGRHQPLEERINRGKHRNKTGVFKVSKDKDYTTKQGFLWRYDYSIGGKIKHIRRVNPNDLKETVLEKGLEWIVIDEVKAMENGLI